VRKTHVALGLGLAACQKGLSVGFTTAAGLRAAFQTGAELLFELISQLRTGSHAYNSNLPFDGWTETLGSEHLTGALLDRITHHVNILEMNGDSYRLAQSHTRKVG
jgi:DNA replication protein DnaC